MARRISALGGAEAYLEQAKERQLRDPVIEFHLSQGFEPIGVLKDFDPSDRQSMGYASHMVWKNPLAPEQPDRSSIASGLLPKETVRVATVQYQMRGIKTEDEFLKQIEYFVDVASDYRADFIVLPELITLQLLSLADEYLCAYLS